MTVTLPNYSSKIESEIKINHSSKKGPDMIVTTQSKMMQSVNPEHTHKYIYMWIYSLDIADWESGQWIFFISLTKNYFEDNVSYIPGIYQVAKDDLDLLILLPLRSKCWYYGHEWRWVLKIEVRVSCIIGKHSSTWCVPCPCWCSWQANIDCPFLRYYYVSVPKSSRLIPLGGIKSKES